MDKVLQSKDYGVENLESSLSSEPKVEKIELLETQTTAHKSQATDFETYPEIFIQKRLNRGTIAMRLMRLALSDPWLTIKLVANPHILKNALNFLIYNGVDGDHIVNKYQEVYRYSYRGNNFVSRAAIFIRLIRFALSDLRLTFKLMNPRLFKKAFRFLIKNEGDGNQILNNYRGVYYNPCSEDSVILHTEAKSLALRYGLSVFRKKDSSAKIKSEDVNYWTENLRRLADKLPEEKPSISIIIPVYNQIRFTLACIHSIFINAGRTDFEIIIADDVSTDETPSAFEGNIRRVRYSRNKNNLGFLNNCNAAAADAQGRFLVFLNNDTIVLPGWLDELIKPFKESPSIGLVGSKLVYPDGRLQEAGGIIFADAGGWNYGRFDDPGKPEYNYMRDADYCSGASIAIPSELWRLLGGFDTRFSPAYYEDTDLSFRIRAAGKRVIYQPLSEVVHFEGISHGTSEDADVKQHQPKNKLKFLAKWQDVLPSYGDCDSTDLPVDRCYKKRILVVDAETPTPDKDSGSIDAINFLRIFKDLGYHVTFIPENLQYCGEYTHALRRIGVECIHLPWYTSLAKAVKHYAPLADFVFLYRAPIAAPLLDTIRKCAPDAKLVFNTVDLHFLREEREAQLNNSSFHFSQAQKMRKMELAVIKSADASILLSSHEMQLVNELIPEARLFHIPIVREIPGPLIVPWEDRCDILFIGGYQHPPNVDAVFFFINEVWPHLKNSGFPGRLIIAGSKMPDKIYSLATDDIIVRGYVPELSELFDSCRLSIAPLRYGAGMKGKVISSLCYGVPCIATSIATEGTSLVDGEHILVEDDPQEMALLIQQAYNDKSLWERLSIKGMQYCLENCSIDSIKKKLELMLSEVAGLKRH